MIRAWGGRRAARVLAAALALASVASAARATPPDASTRAPAPSASELLAARELFAQAIADEKRGEYAAALEKLRRVVTVKATPSVHFHLAYCHEHLGELVLALGAYDAAEREATRERNEDVLRLVRATVPALRARVPTLALDVTPKPAGFVVRLDGRPLASGVLGVPVPVDPGSHVVEAEAPGHEPTSARVELAERDAVARVLHLAPRALAAREAPPAAPASAAATTARAPAAAPAGTPSRRGGRAAPVVATAGAVVFAGAGVGFLLAASARQDSARTACAERVTCDDLRGGVRTLDALALGSFVAAAGVATLAVVLFARGASADDAAEALRIGPGGVGGTF